METILVIKPCWSLRTTGNTVKAITPCTVLILSQQSFEELISLSATLRAHIEQFRNKPQFAHDKYGQAAIELSAGHAGEPTLPSTFVDYEIAPVNTS